MKLASVISGNKVLAEGLAEGGLHRSEGPLGADCQGTWWADSGEEGGCGRDLQRDHHPAL